jgi:hypothetical protein
MQKINTLLVVFVLVSLTFGSKSLAVKEKVPKKIIAICDLPVESYAPSEFIVTMVEKKNKSRQLTTEKFKFQQIEKEKSLKLLESFLDISDIKSTYEPNLELENNIKSKLKILKNKNEIIRLKRQTQFHQLMRESSASRTFIIKTNHKNCKQMEIFAQTLLSIPEVESINLNYLLKNEGMSDGTPNDPEFNNQYHIHNVNAQKAWSISEGSGTRVGVIDSFLEFDHLDLNANVNKNFYGPDLNNSQSVKGNNTHGTMVAGVIGAIGDNFIGGVGIAPKTQIFFGSSVSENYLGDTIQMAEAINYLVTQGVDVINISMGGYLPGIISDFSNHPLYIAMTNAISSGVVIVVSAGNENVDISSTTETIRHSSGQIMCEGTALKPCYSILPSIPGTISVTSVNANGTKSSFSNYGNIATISAPGEDILTTTFNLKDRSHSFEKASGTSFSAPIVAGAVALLLSIKPDLSPAQVTRLLTTSENTEAVSSDTNRPIPRKLNIEKALNNLRQLMSIATPQVQTSNITRQTININWSIVPTTTRYEYQINSLYANTPSNRLTIELPSGNHSFRIRACNDIACSPWSITSNFRIEDNLPGSVIITSPTNKAVFSTNQITLSWIPTNNSSSYNVRVYSANSSAPAWTSIRNTNTYKTTLLNGLNIFEICAINSNGQAGPISKINFFITAHTNPMMKEDVNNDGRITPHDALMIINRVSFINSNKLNSFIQNDAPIFVSGKRVYYDVNSDGYVNPTDANIVITKVSTTKK